MARKIILVILAILVLLTREKAQEVVKARVIKELTDSGMASRTFTLSAIGLIGNRIFGMEYFKGEGTYLIQGHVVFNSGNDIDTLIWDRRLFGFAAYGDEIVTSNGYYVIATASGTYLTPDTGRTWYKNERGLGAMLAMPDGSFLGGNSSGLWRIKTDTPDISNESNWNLIHSSSEFGYNTPRFLYRVKHGPKAGRIVMYVLGVNDNEGGVYISDDDAKTWWRPSSNITGYNHLFSSMAEKSGYIIGKNEDGLYISSDYGETWVKVLPLVFYLDGIRIITEDYIYAGDEGILLTGTHIVWSWDLNKWALLLKDSLSLVGSIIRISPGKFVIEAYEGIYLVQIDVVTNVPEAPHPYCFRLDQNYPNPFNPSTTISFSLPKRSHVVLKVFDIIGREVATLVDGEKEPGEYSVNFDASGLPSGVYFYRMKAGEFIETKKMILVK